MTETDAIDELIFATEDLRRAFDGFAASLGPSPSARLWVKREARKHRRRLRHVEALCRQALQPVLMPSLAGVAYQPPISTEARHARSRGRYGRRRGKDDDHLAPNAKRPGWNRSVAYRGRSARPPGSIYTRLIADRPPHNQAPIPAAQPSGCRGRSRAPAIQNKGGSVL